MSCWWIRHVGCLQNAELPSRAGGASAAFYRFLKIDNHRGFPDCIAKAVHSVGDVVIHDYVDTIRLLHVVSPVFRDKGQTMGSVTAALCFAYTRVFKTYCLGHKSELRLLPISTGINAGGNPALVRMATRPAIVEALKDLSTEERERLKASQIYFCCYKQEEFDFFGKMDVGLNGIFWDDMLVEPPKAKDRAKVAQKKQGTSAAQKREYRRCHYVRAVKCRSRAEQTVQET